MFTTTTTTTRDRGDRYGPMEWAQKCLWGNLANLHDLMIQAGNWLTNTALTALDCLTTENVLPMHV